MMYFDSTGGATALLSNYTAVVSETMQEPWRNLNSLSTVLVKVYKSDQCSYWSDCHAATLCHDFDLIIVLSAACSLLFCCSVHTTGHCWWHSGLWAAATRVVAQCRLSQQNRW